MNKQTLVDGSTFFRGLVPLFCRVALLSLFSLTLFANTGVRARRLTTADGLSNNSVRIFYQDSKGFIWMGSLNGLNRYDGNTFRTFFPKESVGGQLSLADRRIRNMVEDENNFLWITMATDLVSCYDLKRDCFVDFTGCGEQSQRYTYLEIMPGEVWLWGQNLGCRRVVYRDGVFSSQAFDVKRGNLPTDRIYFVKRDREKRVWIGTAKGLYRWQEEELHPVVEAHAFYRMECFGSSLCFIDGKGEIWQTDAQGKVSPTSLHLPEVTSAQHLPGNLVIQEKWLVFTDKGGWLYDPKSRSLTAAPPQWDIPGGRVFTDNRKNYYVHNGTGSLHRIDAGNGETLSLEVMSSQKVALIDMERYHAVHDANDVLWISTYGNGLFTYNLHTKEFTHLPAGNNRSALTASDAQMYIYPDRSGSIWIGSEYAGVSYLNTTNKGTSTLLPAPEELEDGNSDANKLRLVTALDDDVYLATRNGILLQYDASLTTLLGKHHFDKNIYALCKDGEGTLWRGTRGGGLFIGDKLYQHRSDDTTSIPADHVFSLLKDSKNRMWVGTFGGGLALAIPDEKGGFRFRTFFGERYGERRIRSLIEDRQGWIWVGTSDGIIVFHPDQLLKDPAACYRYNSDTRSLRSNEVRHLMQDSRGNIYIAETGTGFSVCKPDAYDKLVFTHYGTEDGLVNNMVQTFTEDAQGKVWIATEYGVSCFTPQNRNFENFFFSGEMSGDTYSESSAARLADGRLLLGTARGAVIIHPELVQTDNRKPAVTFTNLQLDGMTVSPEDVDSPLRQSIAYTQEMELRHSQNSFSIHFSTLDYTAITPYKYSYLLEGYDEAWSIPAVQSYASYKNLSPGTYHFRVRALSASGQWGDESVMQVVVKPPFWQTWYAYIVYLLLTAAVLYIIYRNFRNMNELRNKIKVEEQLTEYKLRFFTNISHEFRTPLTLIQAALERMNRRKIPAEMTDAVQVMEKSTHRLLRLINQLLEFRKMQNDKLALSLEETDVIAFLHEIYLSFKDTAEAKKMEFRFLPSTPAYRMFIDKNNVDKVVYNLVSNAFKYTPSGGSIALAVKVDGASRKLVVSVTDSGVGIPKEKRGELFSRFMQSSFSRDSMGIGLHLTHELVHVHHGNIRYEENPTGGSVFIVTLPLTPAEYEEKDFLVPGNVLLQDEEEQKQPLPGEEVSPADATSADAWTDEATTPESQTPAPPMNKRKILVIEDDTDICRLLKEELSVYFEVETESDGTSGLERARTYDADLIVSDVMMPGYSGLEVTQRLKSDFQTSHIPIILLTALTSPEQHLQGIESGADAYLTKPFSIKLLLARIFKLIEQRDKLREKFSSDLSMVRPLISSNERDKEFTDKLTRIAEEQLENPEFSADAFASMMNMSRSIFFKKVKGVTGYAPMEYLRVLRLKKAAELLATTDFAINEVAYKVGIGDPFYFSRCFKAQFGMAPSVYQKQAREAQE